MSINNSPKNLVQWLELRSENLQQMDVLRQATPSFYFIHDDDAPPLQLTHPDLITRAKSLAALLQQDFAEGDRAILLYPSGLDYIIAFFACLYAGIIAVPAFPPSARRRDWGRIDAIYRNAEPALVLTTKALQEGIYNWQSEQAQFNGVPILPSDEMTLDYRCLWRAPSSDADSIAFLQYSSGSTGSPKGVMVSHGNILHNLKVIQENFSFVEEDRGAGWLPMYHDMGLIGTVLSPFHQESDMYLLSPIDVLQKPVRWLNAISQYRLNCTGGPNFIYDHCVNRVTEEEKAKLDLSCWTLAYNGAEPVNADTMKRFADTFAETGFDPNALTPCYGMAETTLMVSSTRRVDAFNLRAKTQSEQPVVSSGHVHPEFQLKIVKPHTQNPCREGEAGEIWVRGPSVAKGYWQDPERTQQAFAAQPVGETDAYLRTGDLGLMANNELHVTGRIKELIIIRGQNHYPQDIETTAAQSCPELEGCMGTAFAITKEREEQLVLIHEVNRTLMRKMDPKAVFAKVQKAITQEHGLQIHTLVLIKPASLLRTTSGKIRRVAMCEAFANDDLNVVAQIGRGGAADSALEAPKPSVKEQQETELQSVLQWLRGYAETRINSRLIDERRSIPPHIVLDMGNRGLMGLHVPKAQGGMGFSFASAMQVYQQLGAVDPSLALFVGLGNVLGLRPLQRFATKPLQARYLESMASGRMLAAFAITEPGAGSNPLAMTTTAVQDAQGNYVLNGCKVWSGTAAWASVIHVFAKTYDPQGNALGITGFAVEQGLPGLVIGPEALTMGMRGTCQSRVELHNVRVSADAVLGSVGGGMEVAQDAMKMGRLVITAAAVGGMKRCSQLMVRYADRRQVGTGRLLENPVTLQRLQDLKHSIAAVENLVNKVSQCLDKGIEVPIELYISCKIAGPEWFWQGADHLVQMLGGRGYIENNLAPQLLRDARILRIFEGPTETLAMFAGSRLNKSPEDFYHFAAEQLPGTSAMVTLQSQLQHLKEAVENCDGFERRIDAERWLNERCGRLLVLAVLEAALEDKDTKATRLWLRNQTQRFLQDSQLILDFGIQTHPQELIEATADYSRAIGDIQQQAADEDRGLDPYLQRDFNPQSDTSLVSEQSLSNEAIRHAEQVMAQSLKTSSQHQSSATKTQVNVQTWMQNWIASRLQLPVDEVGVDLDFAGFGLDSVDAVELTHDLGLAFNLKVKSDLAWIYPNIQEASMFLSKTLDSNPTSQSAEAAAQSAQKTAVETATEEVEQEQKWLEGEIE